MAEPSTQFEPDYEPDDGPALDRITRIAVAVLGVAMARIAPVGTNGQSGPSDFEFCRDVALRAPDGVALGTLRVMDRVPRVFSSAQTDMLTDLAALAVDVLHARRARTQVLSALSAEIAHGQGLLRLAMTDALTGALNRRAFRDLAEKECARARRRGTMLSLLVFDIDHFKQVNDRFGHAAGDDVLRILVRQLEATIRADEILGRIGGEEFAIMLPGTDAGGARILADRMREQIGALCPVVVAGGAAIAFTISIGVTACDPARESLDAMLRRADAAMYAAKRAGRDRVVSHLAA